MRGFYCEVISFDSRSKLHNTGYMQIPQEGSEPRLKNQSQRSADTSVEDNCFGI